MITINVIIISEPDKLLPPTKRAGDVGRGIGGTNVHIQKFCRSSLKRKSQAIKVTPQLFGQIKYQIPKFYN